jgi:hypothetical protein
MHRGRTERRRNPAVQAQAQSEKRDQGASASAQESPVAENGEQADNVASPSQEQLPNQQVQVSMLGSKKHVINSSAGRCHMSLLCSQEVTMNISQRDLASLKDAIKRQKGGGDDGGFVEVSDIHVQHA